MVSQILCRRDLFGLSFVLVSRWGLAHCTAARKDAVDEALTWNKPGWESTLCFTPTLSGFLYTGSYFLAIPVMAVLNGMICVAFLN